MPIYNFQGRPAEPNDTTEQHVPLINLRTPKQDQGNHRTKKRTHFQSEVLHQPRHKGTFFKLQAYNDAIRVYEAKLVEFGIPPEELGFQILETKTSTMPAGLVSSWYK